MDNLQNDYSIIFSHVQKAYGSNVVINDLNLNIRKGERLILLGPSGCGKTTTLRMIAGFEEITKGELYMDGRVVNDIAPGERNIAMVFQSYALFPHLSVWDNITFGLQMQKLPQAEMEKRARMAAQYAYDGAARTYAPKAGNDYVFGSEYESGGAGLISTVDDYMRFAETLCRFGISAEGERILSENSVRLMRMNHLTAQTQPDFNWTHLDGYGYGLGVRTLVDPTRISTLSLGGEFGWSGAAGAYVIMDPETELTVYYAQHMLNSQEEYVHPRLRNIIYAALQ